MGVSPINKFRYANTEQRSCQMFSDEIEDEKRLLLFCPVYSQCLGKYLSHLSHQSVITLIKSKENNDSFNVARFI